MLDNIGLLKGITGKMGWLSHRQVLVAQNVANSDTPGYIPSDLKKVDFGAVMGAAQNKPMIKQVTTNDGHIGHGVKGPSIEAREQRSVYEAAPDGENAVDLEEQLFKSQSIALDYSLMANLYRKNMNMMRIAIGKA